MERRDSQTIFLAHAAELIRGAGGIIDHVDCTVICEEPKVGPASCRHAVARSPRSSGLPHRPVSIKATTTERLGFTGRGEGIAAQAVANIRMEHATPMSDYSAPRRSGRQGARGGRGQPQGRPPDRGRRKLHRRAGQRRDDRDPGLVGRVRGGLRHLFQRRQDRPSSTSARTWSRPSARSASRPPGRWPRARCDASDADVAVAITGIAGPGGGTGRSRSERSSSPAPSARPDPARSSPTRSCSTPTRAARESGFRRRFARSSC